MSLKLGRRNVLCMNAAARCNPWRLLLLIKSIGSSPYKTASSDTFLTAKEAARIARMHPVTLLRWAREGKVPHRRLSSRKIVFPLGQLTAWLDRATLITPFVPPNPKGQAT
jgi:hypothetical protein